MTHQPEDRHAERDDVIDLAADRLRETLTGVAAILRGGEIDSNVLHSNLRQFEETLCAQVRDILLEKIQRAELLFQAERDALSFLGSFFRGWYVRGGRKDHVAWRFATRINGINSGFLREASAAPLYERTLEAYLRLFGKPYSMNQLVLERERQATQERFKSVEIVFGAEPDEGIVPSADGDHRRLVVPKADIDTLCPEDVQATYVDLLKKIQQEHLAPDNQTSVAIETALRDPKAALRRRELQEAVVLRWLKAWNSPEVADFVGYARLSDKELGELVNWVRNWIRGIQAYTFFLSEWGRFWCTFPISANTLPDVSFVKHFPACAVTFVSQQQLTQGSREQVYNLLRRMFQRFDVSVTEIMSATYETFNKHSFATAKRQQAATSRCQVIDESRKVLSKSESVMSYLGVLGFLLLGERLCEETIEQRRLRFALLLCTPYDLFNRLSGAAGTLEEIAPLHLEDLCATQPTTAEFEAFVEQLIDSVVGNAYLLQEPGTCLVFAPSATPGFEPLALVRTQGHAEHPDYGLREFTKDSGAVGLRVEHGSTELVVDGRMLARFDAARRTWTVQGSQDCANDDLLVEDDFQFLLNSINGFAREKLKRRFQLSERACAVLAGAMLDLRRGGYGALVYLAAADALTARAHRERLGRPWPFVDGKRLEEVQRNYLGRLLAMDGETTVDTLSGQVRGRYFLIPKAPPGILTETGDLEEVFATEWREMLLNPIVIVEQDGKRRRGNIESIGAVLRFGTRHRKAMMMSRALDEDGVVLTISSDGPIRVWWKGLPVSVRKPTAGGH